MTTDINWDKTIVAILPNGERWLGNVVLSRNELLAAHEAHMPIHMRNVRALHVQRHQMSDAQGRAVGLQVGGILLPLDLNMEPTTLSVRPLSYYYPGDGGKATRDKFIALLQQVEDSAMENRAREAGLSLVRPGGPGTHHG
jgi:hypothetical protein